MITREDIADLYIQLESGVKTLSAVDAVRSLLLKSLSPGQQVAYSMLLSGEVLSSGVLRERLEWKPNYSGNILKSLERLGLAVGHWSAHGKTKVYWLSPDMDATGAEK